MKENQIDTRLFVEIWKEIQSDVTIRGIFYDNLKGLTQAAVRSYACGRRRPTGPSMECLRATLRKSGFNVGDGRYLFQSK